MTEKCLNKSNQSTVGQLAAFLLIYKTFPKGDTKFTPCYQKKKNNNRVRNDQNFKTTKCRQSKVTWTRECAALWDGPLNEIFLNNFFVLTLILFFKKIISILLTVTTPIMKSVAVDETLQYLEKVSIRKIISFSVSGRFVHWPPPVKLNFCF